MEKNNGKNLKLIAARDAILAYMMKDNFTVDEAQEILDMCQREIDAAVNRAILREVTICEKCEDALAEKTAEQSEAKFSAEEEERSLRGEAKLNQSQPAFGRDAAVKRVSIKEVTIPQSAEPTAPFAQGSLKSEEGSEEGE